MTLYEGTANLSGKVTRIRYHNPENGWSVFSVFPDKECLGDFDYQEVTVTGEFVIAGWPDFEAAPAVAACAAADQYLVAWQSDQGTGGADYAIYARYLDGDAVPGRVVLVDDSTSPELNVDVGCNLAGKGYLLAWQTRYTNLKYGIWARIAWPNESWAPQFEVVPPGAAAHREYPAIANGRTGALVAWEHQRNSGGNRDIHGRLLQYMLHLPMVLRNSP